MSKRNLMRLGRVHVDIFEDDRFTSFVGAASGYGAADLIVTTVYTGSRTDSTGHDSLTVTWTPDTARAFAALLNAEADRCEGT